MLLKCVVIPNNVTFSRNDKNLGSGQIYKGLVLLTCFPQPSVVEDVEAVLQPHQLDGLGHAEDEVDVVLVLRFK